MFDWFSKGKDTLIIGLVITIVLIGLLSWWNISSLRKALKDADDVIVALRVRNSALQSANVQMASDIDTQNKAVASLREEQKKKSVEVEQELLLVRIERDKWKDKYVVLFKTPPVGRTESENLVALISRYYALRVEEGN